MIKKTEGFTLLELLVVMVIIGMLTGIVGPRLFNKLGSSESTVAKAQIDSISKAVDQFRLDTGHYPSNELGLSSLTTRPPNEPNWHGPYLKKNAPLDPWGSPYKYNYPGKHNIDEYDLYTLGKDQSIGGENANADQGNW